MLTLNSLLGGAEAQAHILVPPLAALADNVLCGLVVAAGGWGQQGTSGVAVSHCTHPSDLQQRSSSAATGRHRAGAAAAPCRFPPGRLLPVGCPVLTRAGRPAAAGMPSQSAWQARREHVRGWPAKRRRRQALHAKDAPARWIHSVGGQRCSGLAHLVSHDAS